ncbi:MAG TPA: glutamate--tRNA ligase [Verrucomicrobiae bacterium]|nr:glutamate--tRNA ligase [Verrucomicrobiae bacterium]
MSKNVRTRMAPSPTGFFHVGSLRTALYNYLFAKKHGGKFILRIEDTDQNRIVEGALENIVQSLHEFGLEADEGPYWENQIKERGDKGPYLQSQRLEMYRQYAQELVDKKAAYYCFCTPQRLEELRNSQEAQKLPPKYDKHCLKLSDEEVRKKLTEKEPYVIRLNVPADQTIRFTDLAHGEITISTNDVDDQVLLKSDGFPTYHLAVVVDDHAMEISHVIRGDEWIPSTPKHILLYSSFGWESPQYVHLPLLLSKSKKKLSKREGDVAVKDFIKQGYLPEALLNFVALLGWNPKTEQEVFTLKELIEQFDVNKLNKSGAVFDLEKLDWINGLYIRKLSAEDLLVKLEPYLKENNFEIENYPKQYLVKIIKLEQERLKKLSEIGERVSYFFLEPEYSPDLLIWKKTDKETIRKNLNSIQVMLSGIPLENFNQEYLEREIKSFIEKNELKTGEVLWPLRVALTGVDASPGPFEIMDAFGVLSNGKDLVLKRIETAKLKVS